MISMVRGILKSLNVLMPVRITAYPCKHVDPSVKGMPLHSACSFLTQLLKQDEHSLLKLPQFLFVKFLINLLSLYYFD